MGAGIAPEFVVTAPKILHERVTAHDDPGGVVAFESARRPDAGFESAVAASIRHRWCHDRPGCFQSRLEVVQRHQAARRHTDSCEAPHTGYVISGRLHVRMDDGTDGEAGPGDAWSSPPDTTPGSSATSPACCSTGPVAPTTPSRSGKWPPPSGSSWTAPNPTDSPSSGLPRGATSPWARPAGARCSSTRPASSRSCSCNGCRKRRPARTACTSTSRRRRSATKRAGSKRSGHGESRVTLALSTAPDGWCWLIQRATSSASATPVSRDGIRTTSGGLRGERRAGYVLDVVGFLAHVWFVPHTA